MSISRRSRRDFLKTSAGLLAASWPLCPGLISATEPARRVKSPNDRYRIGSIGMRYQGSVIADKAQEYGDIVAICDVDREIAEKAKQQFGGKADLYEDYHALLERKDIDVITIGSPDHWHTAMVIDACRAGKDVYCEKPLTLTVDEGKQLTKVVEQTGAVVQVGSWQRSDHRFRLACELVRAGRVGKLNKVTVVLGKNKTGGPFKIEKPPSNLNWNLWQGQTPDVPYIAERSHYTFRWWHEYSGGQMTDWGAHHIDIAVWAMGLNDQALCHIDGKAKFPNVENGYNVAVDFEAKYTYPDGLEMVVLDDGRNGILFEGTEGRLFVNRASITGKPIDNLKDQPLARENFKLYADDNLTRPERAGKLDAIINHMGNFFDRVKTRKKPLSDVWSQHRSITACHVANISMRLGRKLTWDPSRELFTGDEEANRWLKREQREGFRTSADV